MRVRLLLLPLAILGGMASLPMSAHAASSKSTSQSIESDALSRMFRWWNSAMATPGALTREAFAKHFTFDATLTINGEQVIAGVDGWVAHFRRIQASGAKTEIVVPFKTVIEARNRIYTHHVIRSMRGARAGCMLAAGHATLRRGLISSVTLVRVPLEQGKPGWDSECWSS